MTGPVQHVIMTRFNLPSVGHESVVRAHENWLRDRVELFERYCVPSVLRQTCPDSSWLVYLDPASPRWLLDRVREHERQGHFRPVLREQVPRADLLADIREVLPRRPGADLVTTNLDNDDSLAPDFVARVRAVPRTGERCAVYLADGLIVRGHELFAHLDPHNAFCSVRETWTDPVTCWSDWHNRLPDHMPAVVQRGAPGWLQVVHGGNVSNRVRGRRVRPSAHAADFPGTLDGLPEPTTVGLARDAALDAPKRYLRDSGRATLKRAVEATMGRDGIDRVKLLATGVRGRS